MMNILARSLNVASRTDGWNPPEYWDSRKPTPTNHDERRWEAKRRRRLFTRVGQL